MNVFRRILLAAGATILIAAAALLLLTGTGPGRSLLASTISSLASGEATTVRVEGIDGIWSGALTVERVEIGDRDGIWLAIDDLAVDLDRSALLRPALVASSVSATLIDVARRPVAGEGGEGGGGLPLELDIAAFDLPDIRLGAPLVGEAARLAATGRLRAEAAPLDIAANAEIRRTDEREGRVALDIAFAPDEGRLVLDVEAEEPAGGVVVSLLDIPGLPRLTLAAKGEGSLDDFHADLALALDGSETVTGDVLIRSVEGGRNGIVNLNGRLAPFVSRALRPLLAGSNAVSLDARLADDGPVTINRILFESATTRLDASGRFDPASRQMAVDFDAALAAPGTELQIERPDAPPLRLGHTTVKGTLEGRLDAADLSVRIGSDHVALNGQRLDGLDARIAAEGADLGGRVIPFSANIALSGLETGNPAADAIAGKGLTLRASGRLDGDALTLVEADLAARAVTVTAGGTIDIATAAANVRINAVVDPSVDHPAARWLAGQTATLAANLARSANGDLSLTGIDLASALAEMTGAVTLADGALEGTLGIVAGDLAAVDQRLEGGIDLEVALSGPVSAPLIKVTGTGNGLVAMGEAIEELQLAAEIVADPASPRGDLSVDAAFRGQPLEIAATLAPGPDGAPRADPVRIRIAGATIAGTGALSAAGPVADLAVDIPDLAVLGPFLLRDDLSGSLAGHVALVSDAGRTDLTTRMTSPGLSAFGITVGEVSATGGVGDVFGTPAPEGEVRADSLAVAGTTIRDLVATAELDGPKTRFEVSGDAKGIPLEAAGTLTPGETVAIALDRARVSWRGIDARLAAPSTVRIVDGAARLDGFAISLGSGQATVTGTAGGTLDLDVRLASVPVSLANAFASGLGLQGAVSGTVDVTGPAGNPRVGYDLNVAGASTETTRQEGIPALSVAANGAYVDKAVSIASSLTGAGLDFSISGRVGLSGTPSPNLTVDGTVPFSLAAARLASSGLRLTGSAATKLQISGTTASPQISGTISTAGATFVDTRSNLVLRNLAASARFAGDRIVIDSATADIAAGGRASVTGSIALGGGLPADLAVRVTDGVYADGRIVSAEFSADLKVTGPLAVAPQLGGTVTIARADITLPEKIPGGIDVVAVEHRNAPADVRAQADELKSASGGGGGSALGLDVTVVADRRIFVRGRGVDAEFGGRLRLVGPASSPRASGRFNLVRGRMDVLGRRLAFSRGTIGFNGSLVPDINFSASSQTSAATVSINLIGPATDPEVTITSTPELPDDEALALLIFDRSAGSLSPVQVVQLADALTALGNGGTGVIEQLRSSIGIDNIDITTDESGQGAAVSVGRYVNDRTYVGVRQGTESGSTRVTIDLDITDDIKVRGETGANGTTKGGIFFERDY